MKKFLLMIVVLVIALFAACGRDDPPPDDNDDEYIEDVDYNDEDDFEIWSGIVSRGRWDGNIYINEYLHLRFAAPAGWHISCDNEIAENLGQQRDTMPDETWELFEEQVFVDMLATDMLTGTHVQLYYERLPRPLSRITSRDYLQQMIDNDDSDTITIQAGTTRIGNYDWYSFASITEMLDTPVKVVHFVNVHQGIARVITVVHEASHDPLSEILAMFTSLDQPAPPTPDPTPSPDTIPDPALVGAWAWDEYLSFIYEFNADGTGRAGFYPEMDDITWVTFADDNYLIICFGFMTENWTYAIYEDTLSLESRAVPGTVDTFIRWEGDFIESDSYDVDFTGHPLVGTWEWDEVSSFIIILNYDGTGERGFDDQLSPLFWYAFDDTLLMDVGGFGLETWTFSIAGNVLSIVNVEDTDQVWSYIRQ